MFVFKSTKLLKQLEEVRSRFAGRSLSARLSVPPDLDWWYFQEYGTATHANEAGAGTEVEPGIFQAEVQSSSHPEGYSIYPVNAKMLRWPISAGGKFADFTKDGYVYRLYVPWHPGVPQKGYVRRVLVEIQEMASGKIAAALVSSKYDLDSVRAQLLETVMPAVKEAIASSMAEALTGTRPDGKLQGQSADSAFRAGAYITELSK